METSKEGLEFLTILEGKRNKAYKDTSNLWTIGVGHLIIRPTEDYLLNKTLTDQDILDLLSKDLKVTEKVVSSLIKQSLLQNQFDALVSLVFNIGQGNFRNSSVLRFINLNQTDKIENAWLAWRNSAGKPILLDRRKKEYNLFKNNNYKLN